MSEIRSKGPTVEEAEEWKSWSFKGGDRWGEWMDFSTAAIGAVKAGPGAYVLGLPQRPDSRGLGRLLGHDVHSILDVGESNDLRGRLTNLRRCATTETAGHMAGWRLGRMGLLARLGLDAGKLQISVCAAKSKDEAYRMEGTILRIYFELFGELPPLNYKFNWSTWEDA